MITFIIAHVLPTPELHFFSTGVVCFKKLQSLNVLSQKDKKKTVGAIA